MIIEPCRLLVHQLRASDHSGWSLTVGTTLQVVQKEKQNKTNEKSNKQKKSETPKMKTQLSEYSLREPNSTKKKKIKQQENHSG